MIKKQDMNEKLELREKVFGLFGLVYTILQVIFIVVGACLLLALIPGIDKTVSDFLGIPCKPSANLVTSVIGVGLIIIFTSVKVLIGKIQHLREEVFQNVSLSVYRGATEMQLQMERIWKKISRRHRFVTVIGLTNEAAWVFLHNALNEEQAYGWRITLFQLHPDFIRENSEIFPDGWIEQTQLVSRQIKKYCEEHAGQLKSKRIKIKLYQYRLVPSVHGIYFGSGEIFVSMQSWNLDNNLTADYHWYDHYDHRSRTAKAEAYRRLFNNWRAKLIRVAEKIDLD